MTILCKAIVAALNVIAAGQTITPTGDCPASITIKGKTFSPPIVIDARGATLHNVVLDHTDGVTWVGGRFDGTPPASVVSSVLSTVGLAAPTLPLASGFDINYSQHVTVEWATFTNYRRNAIGVGNSSAVVISHNHITGSGSDGVDFALSQHGLIDHNTFDNFIPTPGAHPDPIQLWSRPGWITSDVAVTHNIIGTAQTPVNAQGISAFNHVRSGIDDGGFDRLNISFNFVNAGYDDGLSVYSCRKCTVRFNTLPRNPMNRHANQLHADLVHFGNTGGIYDPNTVN